MLISYYFNNYSRWLPRNPMFPSYLRVRTSVLRLIDIISGRAQRRLAKRFYRFREFGHRIRGAGFIDKTHVAPLQVADFVAYETYRYESEVHLSGRPERWQNTLLRKRWRRSVFMDAAYLEQTVRRIEEKAKALSPPRP